MPFSGCSALHGANPNLKKKKRTAAKHIYFFSPTVFFNDNWKAVSLELEKESAECSVVSYIILTMSSVESREYLWWKNSGKLVGLCYVSELLFALRPTQFLLTSSFVTCFDLQSWP